MARYLTDVKIYVETIEPRIEHLVKIQATSKKTPLRELLEEILSKKHDDLNRLHHQQMRDLIGKGQGEDLKFKKNAVLETCGQVSSFRNNLLKEIRETMVSTSVREDTFEAIAKEYGLDLSGEASD